jgi:hypothetical protein
VAQEHALILQSALRRDGVLAAALIASHIRATSENLLDHKLDFTAAEASE